MAEYIEKEKVIERIDLSIKSWSADYNSNSPNMVRAYKDVKSRLESIPAADVVEVCRCKDCIRGRKKFSRYGEPLVECQLYHYNDTRQYKGEMDYCSQGVSREMRSE